MRMVLNERESACEAIENKCLGDSPLETLSRVARYIKDENEHFTRKEIRKRLDLFLLRCIPDASLPKWDKTLDIATNWALKHRAVQIESLIITKPEMEIIDTLKGKQVRRLAFVLLCLSKYWDEVIDKNNHWVNSKDNEIMSLANINTSIRRQCSMYATLRNAGLIQFAKRVDSTKVQVCFAKKGEPAIVIKDLRNLGYQYLKYHGEPYFECANCGIVTRYKNPENKKSVWQQKYCKACAIEIDRKQRISSVRRSRSKLATHESC